MRQKRATVTVLAGLLLIPGPGPADIVIDHAAVNCVVAEKYPVFGARFSPASGVSRAVLFFRPGGGRHWYTVAFTPRTTSARGATLPRPKKELKSFDYYIEAVDPSMGTSRTAEFTATVVDGPGACSGKAAGGSVASASVLVEGAAGAPPLPAGFSNVGVMTASAPTASAPAASAPAAGATAAAAAAAATTAVAAGGGIGATTIVLGGLLVAGGATAAVVATRQSDPLDTDDDGDGVSENAGDCDDARPQVKPGGGFQYTAVFGTQGTVPCSASIEWFGRHRVANNSCDPLAVHELVYTHRLTCSDGYSESQPATIPVTVTTVAPGADVEIADRRRVLPVLCCTNGPCPDFNFTCTDEDTWEVRTSQGNRTAVQSITFTANGCPACPPRAAGSSLPGHCREITPPRLN